MLRFLLILALFAPLYADGSKFKPGLTVVLDLNGTVATAAETISAMKTEVRTAMKQTGIAVDFKFWTQYLSRRNSSR